MRTRPQDVSYPTRAEAERALASRSRRGFLGLGAAAVAGYGAWRWAWTQPADEGALRPLRQALTRNEGITRRLFSDQHLAKTFPVSMAREPRANGDAGLTEPLDRSAWRLSVEGLGDGMLSLTLADLRGLPRVDMTTELCCIEGWSEVVRWGGVRLRDFARRYVPADRPLPAYVELATPDEEYYVGLDQASALHPQTLLCDEMNGAPLSDDHGAPLRLVIPVKYGIKNLKRIGSIHFTDDRPDDYWAERGYDWYAGL